jgi:hypothetical protein
MTDFTNAAGTGYVDGDGFRGAPIPGVNPASAGNLTHKPASFPSGISGQPSIAPTLVVAAGASQGNATKLTGNGMYFASTTTSLEGPGAAGERDGPGTLDFRPHRARHQGLSAASFHHRCLGFKRGDQPGRRQERVLRRRG